MCKVLLREMFIVDVAIVMSGEKECWNVMLYKLRWVR